MTMLQLTIPFSPPEDKYGGQEYFTDDHGIDYIRIGRWNQFLRYIASDGWPYNLNTRTGQLSRAHYVADNSPMWRTLNEKTPYLRMTFHRRFEYIHRIVARFFLNGGQPIPPGMQVDHLNANHQDNSVANLEIVTLEENYRRRNLAHHYKRMSAHTRRLSKERSRRYRARIRARLAAQKNINNS